MTTPPSWIRSEHWQEWLNSGVDPEIISRNVRSVSDLEIDPYTHEVTTPIAELLNRRYVRYGQQSNRTLRGWVVQGLDPETRSKMDWLRLKPDADTPILDSKKGTPAKYLSPSGQESRVTFLDPGKEIWVRISLRCGVPIGEKDTDFWLWVGCHVKVPITLTEGEKKAGCLLTQGHTAIALPGITGAIRTRDKDGCPCIPYLIPDLKRFAQPGRDFSICFDHETKNKTIQAINREIEKLKTALTKEGCTIKVICLPGSEKGVDDFIVAQGAEAYDQAYESALTFDQWQAHRFTRLTHPASLTLNQEYLGKFEIPETAKLVCLKAPKGSGKTESFIEMAAEATAKGQRVLLLTHRVQLGQALCDRIGLPYVTEIRSSEEGALLGYGLCIDSLHPESQARFNAEYWNGALVIIDECEQVFWHLLSANTEVAKRRIPILGQLKELLINTFESDCGRVVLADADLSDLSIDFVWGLAEQKIQPWILLNEYKPKTPWTINHYPQKSPDQCFAALNREIAKGGKVFIFTQSRSPKGKWSTSTIEAWARKYYPDKRILRIDALTISDPTHPAYLCTSKLNEVLPNYDIVIASPSIETGVSIDIRGHFTSVWAFLNGVTPENSARQAIARVREAVPRHIWVASRGVGKIANGSTSAKALLRAEYEIAKIASKLIQLVSFDEEMVAAYGSALKTWAKMAARINAGVINYRQAVINGLKAEGHTIVEADGEIDKELSEQITASRDEGYLAEREAIANAPEITLKEHDDLKGRKAKTKEDWHKERKFSIHQRYQVDVTPELVEKDDKGWYAKLRLHYFLTFGRQFLQERDRQSLEQAASTNGTWLPAFNRSQITTRVAALEALGIKKLFDLDADFNGGTKKLDYQNAHPALLEIVNLSRRFRWNIRDLLEITISEEMSPIQIAQALLGKLGIKLTCDRQQGAAGCRERVYRYVPPKDGRDQILQSWFTRDDSLSRNESAMHTPGIYKKDIAGEGRAA